jgi:hypothetical protein
MQTPPDPLDRLLDRWSGPADPVPSLEREVWRRIAQTEASRGDGAWSGAAAWLSRPPFAAMFVASCALLGLFLAEVRVNRAQREQSAALARSYLHLINPLLREPDGRRP